MWTAWSASARSGIALAKAWYLVSEWLATFLPSAVVTDARAIQDYYRKRYGKRTDVHSVWRGDRQGGIHRGARASWAWSRGATSSM